jgi:hypothetical protein
MQMSRSKTALEGFLIGEIGRMAHSELSLVISPLIHPNRLQKWMSNDTNIHASILRLVQ